MKPNGDIAEKILLGTMLYSPCGKEGNLKAFDWFIERDSQGEIFFGHDHRIIFSVILKKRARQAIGSISIFSHLQSIGKVGPNQYVKADTISNLATEFSANSPGQFEAAFDDAATAWKLKKMKEISLRIYEHPDRISPESAVEQFRRISQHKFSNLD